MTPEPFWPQTAEGWSTLVSNGITIGLFVFGFVPALKWANAVRRDLEAIRTKLRADTGRAVKRRAPLQNIQLIRQPGSDDSVWDINWSPLGYEGTPSSGLAKIKSRHLLRAIRTRPDAIKASKYATVVGTVKYTDFGRGNLGNVVVVRVHHIRGDGVLRNAWLWLLKRIST